MKPEDRGEVLEKAIERLELEAEELRIGGNDLNQDEAEAEAELAALRSGGPEVEETNDDICCLVSKIPKAGKVSGSRLKCSKKCSKIWLVLAVSLMGLTVMGLDVDIKELKRRSVKEDKKQARLKWPQQLGYASHNVARRCWSFVWPYKVRARADSDVLYHVTQCPDPRWLPQPYVSEWFLPALFIPLTESLMSTGMSWDL